MSKCHNSLIFVIILFAFIQKKISLLKSHAIAQYDRKGNPIKVYDNMNDVIKENPTFKGQPIRGVCNGSKKTAYGFIWRYVNSDGTIKE